MSKILLVICAAWFLPGSSPCITLADVILPLFPRLAQAQTEPAYCINRHTGKRSPCVVEWQDSDKSIDLPMCITIELQDTGPATWRYYDEEGCPEAIRMLARGCDPAELVRVARWYVEHTSQIPTQDILVTWNSNIFFRSGRISLPDTRTKAHRLEEEVQRLEEELEVERQEQRRREEYAMKRYELLRLLDQCEKGEQ